MINKGPPREASQHKATARKNQRSYIDEVEKAEFSDSLSKTMPFREILPE